MIPEIKNGGKYFFLHIKAKVIVQIVIFQIKSRKFLQIPSV